MPEAQMMNTVTIISQKLDGTDRRIQHFPKVESVTVDVEMEEPTYISRDPLTHVIEPPPVKHYQYTLNNPAQDPGGTVMWELRDVPGDDIRNQANLIYMAMQDVTEDHIVTKNSAMLVAEQLAKSLFDKGYILRSKTFEVL